MAAKRKVKPPKPRPNRTWSELTPAEQNEHYSRALLAYGRGEGPNPQTRLTFYRERAAAEHVQPALVTSH